MLEAFRRIFAQASVHDALKFRWNAINDLTDRRRLVR